MHIYSDTPETPQDNQGQPPLIAVCMTCGSHYVESFGWLDAEDL